MAVSAQSAKCEAQSVKRKVQSAKRKSTKCKSAKRKSAKQKRKAKLQSGSEKRKVKSEKCEKMRKCELVVENSVNVQCIACIAQVLMPCDYGHVSTAMYSDCGLVSTGCVETSLLLQQVQEHRVH